MHKLGLWSFTWADYFSDLDVAACVFKENGPIETFDVALKAHRISNNMVPKLPAQK